MRIYSHNQNKRMVTQNRSKKPQGSPGGTTMSTESTNMGFKSCAIIPNVQQAVKGNIRKKSNPNFLLIDLLIYEALKNIRPFFFARCLESPMSNS